ncbi:MAG TPA: hypothetical protein VGN57_15245 [Pirellulaceae bacterium]|jgi:hypothetical protein|nr:hypothetical protein [Pirellulaceae bacterium]
MNFIYEQPFWVGFLGAALTLGLLVGWAYSARREVAIAALVVLALTVALVAAGVAVETDREAVTRTLAQIATDVESNDLERVLRHISSQAPSIRSEAEAEFPRYRFEAVEVKWQLLEIEIEEAPTGEKQAHATFNVVVTGDLRSAAVGSQTVPRYVEVDFVQEGDAWKVAGYSHDDAMKGFKKKPVAE